MEVIKLENMGYYRDDMSIPGDVFLLQVSNYFTIAFSSTYLFPGAQPYCQLINHGFHSMQRIRCTTYQEWGFEQL